MADVTLQEVREIVETAVAAQAKANAELIAAAVQATRGEDPLRDEGIHQRRLAVEQEAARAKIQPLATVLEAGSGAGDVLVKVRLRDRYSHRPGGNKDTARRGPATLMVPFREAWSAAPLFPEKGNTARWDTYPDCASAGQMAATVRALINRRAQAEAQFAQGKRRVRPAEIRCTLVSTEYLHPKEREIPDEARW